MSRGSIQEIDSLPRIGLSEKLPSQTADIINVDNKVTGKFPLYAKREHVGVRRCEVGINGVVELARSITEWDTILHEGRQRVGYGLGGVGHRQRPDGLESRIGREIAEQGVGCRVEQIRKLVLDEIDGIGGYPVMNNGRPSANYRLFIAEYRSE